MIVSPEGCAHPPTHDHDYLDAHDKHDYLDDHDNENQDHDDQAFYDTIEESADKLWLHTNELAGKSLKKV